MALPKQNVAITFQSGLSQKTDPYQLPPGKFAVLNNAIQNKLGRIEKRFGNRLLANLPDDTFNYLTTFNGNLSAISSELAAYIEGTQQWVTKGAIQPVELDTLPLIRSNTNQSQADIAVTANNLICTVYTDAGVQKVAIADATTGQNIMQPTELLPDAGFTVSGSPRVFALGNYFVAVYGTVSGGTNHLVYAPISVVAQVVPVPSLISSDYLPNTHLSFDGTLANNQLYLGWGGSTTNTAHFAVLSAVLNLSAVRTVTNQPATVMNMANDATNIWATYADAGTGNVLSVCFDYSLNAQTGFPVLLGTQANITNVSSSPLNSTNYTFLEVDSNYAYTVASPPAIESDYVMLTSVDKATATPVAPAVLIRSVGLASKAITLNGVIYVVAVYQSSYQPGYYLINTAGNIISEFAYGNGSGYYNGGTPNLVVDSTGALLCPYLIKDLIQSVNKNTNVPTGSQVVGVYSQTGVNLIKFTFGGTKLVSSEIGNNLSLNGGFLWGYDGYTPVENNFFVWPDDVQAEWNATGGSMAAQPDGATNTNAYYYQVTYEWTDNQGNAFRSAPSIPVAVTTSGSASTGSVLLNIPKLRLTYKTLNPVKIVIYRWSLGQQSYYQVTSIASPTLNNSGSDPDLIIYTDTLADSSILGNNLIYTTGSVVENVSAPSFVATTLFDTRLWGIDSEDQNLLWFSKQVIESTPVEMSDLFTIYVPPSTGTGGSTGPLRCLAPMDDKLILFKDNAIYYINGTGPDNTGANNQYSQATFITSTIGCSNQRSIVLTPNGLMFQSNNGIWLLGRDLQTSYLGNNVSDYNADTVLAAINVPETNQIRFNLASGTTLVYNYFFDQWSTSTYSGIMPVSSTVYKGLTVLIDSLGRTFIENPGSYLDGSNPVLMNLTTSWFNLTGLQGFERFYYMQMLGTYSSPHKLVVSFAYDYASSPQQSVTITPDNYSRPWGADIAWGTGTTWGGALSLEQWQIFPEVQKCQSFQVTIQEQFDPSYGTISGAAISISGLNMVVGAKRGYAKLPGSRQAG